MKKSILLPLLLLAVGLFAQKNLTPSAEKNLPPVDPMQFQGPLADTEPPTLVCVNGLIANLLQAGQLSLWDTDFLQSVTDNETPAGQIKTGIRLAGMGTGFPVDMFGNPITSVTFSCNDIGIQAIELWAIDASGNSDYCQTNVEIKDGFNYCNTSNFDTVNVCVTSGCTGAPMPGVTIQIDGTVIFQPPFSIVDSVTGPDGCANIVVPNPFSNYTIFPNLDDDPLNGVTTFDLLLISKHITGVEPLDNPYKMIAADANKSGSINSFDLVELRKLIMGIYSELPNNTPWRFVDAGFMFPNPMNPFMTAFPEVILVSNSSTLTDTSFLGVKIGDVDCTAELDGAAGPPDYPDAFLGMPDTVLLAGQVYDIPIFMTQNGTWQGYQFALAFDPQKLEVLDIINNPMNPPGYWNLSNPGKMATSWTQFDVPVGFGPNSPLTTIRFRALQTLALKDVVSISNTGLHAEGYAGPTAEKHDLLLSFVPQFKSAPGISSAEKTEPSIAPTEFGDFEPPTIVCLNGLSANIMPTGSLNIWATDLLQFVSDNATPVDQIRLGIRRAGTGAGFPFDNQTPAQPINSLLFTCDDVDTSVTIELWAMDASGNTAFCTIDLIVQDNFGNCPGSNSINLFMCAKVMCSGEAIETAVFYIDGSSTFAPPFSYFDLTDASGCMEFFNNVPIAGSFTIVPEKDDNPLNGMDEQDFLLLSKHINGTQPFTEPWQWVAADANKDGLVTLEDSVEFRNLMLGIYTELPNNTAWRFVPSGYQFPAPNPLSQPFPESISIANALTDMDTSFLGIKIGDLDCSASPNFSSNPTADRINANAQEKSNPSHDPTQLGDFEPPTLVCDNSVIVNVSPWTGSSLHVWSALQTVHDNATPVAQIDLALRLSGTGTGFPVDAQGNPIAVIDLGCGSLGGYTVEVWAMDASGNTAFCETQLAVINPLEDCPPGSGSGLPIINVCAVTETTDGVEELEFDVQGSNPNGPFFVENFSDDDHACGYFGVPLGSNVTAAPVKDDNPLNGVTTYDLVLIDKHIRGIEPLNSPYKIIAADADRNGVIDSVDILELRNLMLGIYTELPNNTSWRFVPKEFVFIDPNNPFATPFPESATILNIQMGVHLEFVGIKVGDVNNTAVANNWSPVVDERTEALGRPTIGQARPNPTGGSANLPIFLPNAENLRVELSDLSGKLLWFSDLQLDSGTHTLEIPASAMPIAGMYVWRVRAGEVLLAGKLVRQ